MERIDYAGDKPLTAAQRKRIRAKAMALAAKIKRKGGCGCGCKGDKCAKGGR